MVGLSSTEPFHFFTLIQELLVAVDDTGNYRYTAYIDANSVTTPLYVECEPAFVAEENEISDFEDTLDHPFSMSSVSQDEESSTVSFVRCLPLLTIL